MVVGFRKDVWYVFREPMSPGADNPWDICQHLGLNMKGLASDVETVNLWGQSPSGELPKFLN